MCQIQGRSKIKKTLSFLSHTQFTGGSHVRTTVHTVSTGTEPMMMEVTNQGWKRSSNQLRGSRSTGGGEVSVTPGRD